MTTQPMPIIPSEAIRPLPAGEVHGGVLARIVYCADMPAGTDAYWGEQPGGKGAVLVVRQGLTRAQRKRAVAEARSPGRHAPPRLGPGVAAVVMLSADWLRRVMEMAGACAGMAGESAQAAAQAAWSATAEHAAVASAAAALVVVGGITAATLPHHPGHTGIPPGQQVPLAVPSHHQRHSAEGHTPQVATPKPTPDIVPDKASSTPIPLASPPLAGSPSPSLSASAVPSATVSPTASPVTSPEPTDPPAPDPSPSCEHGNGRGHCCGDDDGCGHGRGHGHGLIADLWL